MEKSNEMGSAEGKRENIRGNEICRMSFLFRDGEGRKMSKVGDAQLKRRGHYTPRARAPPHTLKRRKINIVCTNINDRERERKKINTLAHHRTCQTDISSTPLLDLSTIGMQLRITYGFAALEFRAAAAASASNQIVIPQDPQAFFSRRRSLGGIYIISYRAEEDIGDDKPKEVIAYS